MMRIAGRGHEGTAKPISLNENDEVKTSQVLRMTRAITRKELPPNEEYATGNLSTGRYTKGTLNLRMGNARATEVYIQYSDVDGIPTGPKILLYRSDGTKHVHQITFPLIETLYELTIKNIATDGNNSTTPSSTITLSHGDDVLGAVRNLKDETLENLKLFKKEVMDDLADEFNKKKPKTTLKWNTTNIDIQEMCVGYDNKIYILDTDFTIKVYDDLIEGEPLETGITLEGDVKNLLKFYVMPEGVTYFVGKINTNNEISVYHAPDIQTQPTLVYTSQTNTPTYFTRSFGIDGYTNGINSILLAGAYGTGQDEKPLILSLDGGQTFQEVKKSQNKDTSGNFNSHWHDVAIDPYHGYLWASEGDNPTNQAVWFSDDLGESWTEVQGAGQPTGLAVFPTRLSLGRDSGLVGLDNVDKADLVNGEMKVSKLRDFKNAVGWNNYGNKPFVLGNQGYMNFDLYSGANRPMTVATGDGGASWHGVSFGVSDIERILGLDNQFLYGKNKNSTKLLYAEKIEWL